jgi:hypothetical protein
MNLFLLCVGILSLPLQLGGCAAFTKVSATHSLAVGDDSDGIDSEPFTVNVDSETYDGQQLVSNLKLVSRTTIDPQSLALIFRLFRHGEIIDKQVYSVASFFPEKPQFEADSEYAIQLVGQATDLENYQVEIIWGEEARQLLAEAQAQRVTVRVDQATLEPYCAEEKNCGARMVATVMLTNESKVTCNGVLLDAGLDGNWQRGAAQTLSLDQVKLAPGESRQLKLRFSALVETDAQVRPYVSFKKCLETVVNGSGG